jgi:replicative DNA helicase
MSEDYGQPMDVTSTSVASQFERAVPHDLAAERCLLASLLLDCSKIPEYQARTPKPAFFQPDHQVIFEVSCDVYREKKDLDPVILSAALQARKLLEEVGGMVYLGEILNAVPSTAHIEHYHAIVMEHYRWRLMIEQADNLLRSAYAPRKEAAAIEAARKMAAGFADISAGGSIANVVTIGEAVRNAYDAIGKTETLLPFCFADLDEATGGAGPGEMIIVGARPSMGKSTLLRQIGLRSGKAGIPTALISVEEGEAKIGRNTLSALSSVENKRIRGGKDFLPEEWSALQIGVEQAQGIPWWITNRHRTMAQIYAFVHMMKAKYGVVRFLVDYLQKIPGVEGRDRFEKVTNASLQLSELFQQTQTQGIVAVQLSRALGSRDDKRPTMFDIRESGQIEQDADAILMLHREDYYHIQDPEYVPKQVAEIIIEKFRDSARGLVVKLRSDLRFQRFDDLSAVAKMADQAQQDLIP